MLSECCYTILIFYGLTKIFMVRILYYTKSSYINVNQKKSWYASTFLQLLKRNKLLNVNRETNPVVGVATVV
jgi:hypothetical protein